MNLHVQEVIKRSGRIHVYQPKYDNVRRALIVVQIWNIIVVYRTITANRTCPECDCDITFEIIEPDYDVGLMGYGAMYWHQWEHELWCTWAWYVSKVEAMEDEVMREYPLESVDYYGD